MGPEKRVQRLIGLFSHGFESYLVVKVLGKNEPYARWRYEQAIRPASRMLAFLF